MSSQQQPLTLLPTRIGHSGVSNNEKVYLFGGFVKNPDPIPSRPLIYSNDLIEIDVSTQLWRNLTLDQQLLGPCARNCHSACMKNQDEMIIFGGKSNGFHRDVWIFDFNVNVWTQLKTSDSDVISPRYGQSSVVFKDHLFVFGGYDNNSFTSNQLFKLNLKSLEWKVVDLESNNSNIAKRYYHASVLDQESGEWYIHGGKTANSIVTDTIKICLDSIMEDDEKASCRAEIIVPNLSEHFARFGHSMVLEGKKLYSVGGCNQRQDFTDCTCLDLENVSEGWKIVKLHALSSIFNETNKEEAQPFLHSLVQIPGTDNSVNYFVFGGLYQKTDNNESVSSVNTADTNTVGKSKKSQSFDIELFNKSVNDDIFRTVLSFLKVDDLLKLHLVSNSLRICQLTKEDHYWKDYYFKKIKEFREASSKTQGVYDSVLRRYVYESSYSSFFDSYLEKKSNYKENLINALRSILSRIEKKSIERTLKIEKLKQKTNGTEFIPKSEVLKYSNLNQNLSPNDSFKIVAVGDGAVGKTSLFITYANGKFPEDYIPTVFDNYNLHLNLEDQNYTVGLWDTAGPEEYDRLRPLSYPQTDLFLLCFSCVSETSFFNVADKWIPELKHYCSEAPIALVNTKFDYHTNTVLNKKFILQCDEKPITSEQGELMAKKMGCLTYFEISSLENIGIDDLSGIILKSIAISKDKKYLNQKTGSSGDLKKCLIQ